MRWVTAALPFAERPVQAQAYPSRTITLVVPFPAGGATDLVARVLAKGLSERTGQPVIVTIDQAPMVRSAVHWSRMHVLMAIRSLWGASIHMQ